MTDPTTYIAALALSMARTSTAMATLPFASRSWAGSFVIVPMALAVAIVMPAPLTAVPSAPKMVLLVVKEAAVGLALGLLIARAFHVVAAAGALLDQQAGYTFGAALNPTSNTTSGPLETLFTSLLILMLFSGGGAFTLAKGLLITFESWPVLDLRPFQGWQLDDLRDHLLGVHGQLMYELALQLAGPGVAMLLVADVSLMVAARYAQQLSPFSISLATKALVIALILGWLVHGQAGSWSALLDAVVPVP